MTFSPLELPDLSLDAAGPGPAGRALDAAGQGWLDRLRWALSDVRVLTWRTLARIATTPEQLLNVTVQPLVFVLLFSYVFGEAITLPGHGSYRDYLIAGIVAVNMGGTAQGTPSGSPSICPPVSSTGSGRCRCRARPSSAAAPSPT